MRSAPLPENIMPCGAGTVKKKYGFFRIHASLQIMSLLRRPRGQFAEAASRSGSLSCLILAGAAKRLTKCCLISISSAPPADRSAAHLKASFGSRAARALSA